MANNVDADVEVINTYNRFIFAQNFSEKNDKDIEIMCTALKF